MQQAEGCGIFRHRMGAGQGADGDGVGDGAGQGVEQRGAPDPGGDGEGAALAQRLVPPFAGGLDRLRQLRDRGQGLDRVRPVGVAQQDGVRVAGAVAEHVLQPGQQRRLARDVAGLDRPFQAVANRRRPRWGRRGTTR